MSAVAVAFISNNLGAFVIGGPFLLLLMLFVWAMVQMRRQSQEAKN